MVAYEWAEVDWPCLEKQLRVLVLDQLALDFELRENFKNVLWSGKLSLGVGR